MCEGTGIHRKEFLETINIPPYTVSGEEIKLTKKGNQAPNNTFGDLLVSIVVYPHDKFRIKWLDDSRQ